MHNYIKIIEAQKFMVYGHECWLETSEYYSNKRLRIELICQSGPMAILTTNLPSEDIESDEIIVKAWSENEEIAAECVKLSCFEDTGKRISTGYVQAQIWRLA